MSLQLILSLLLIYPALGCDNWFLCDFFEKVEDSGTCKWKDSVDPFYQLFFATFDPHVFCCECLPGLEEAEKPAEWLASIGVGVCTSDDGGFPLIYLGYQDSLDACKQSCEKADEDTTCYGVAWEEERQACQLYTWDTIQTDKFVLTNTQRISWNKGDNLVKTATPPVGHPNVECIPLQHEADVGECVDDFACQYITNCDWDPSTPDSVISFMSGFDATESCCGCKVHEVLPLSTTIRNLAWNKLPGLGSCTNADGGHPLMFWGQRDTLLQCKRVCEEVMDTNGCYGINYDASKFICLIYTWSSEPIEGFRFITKARVSFGETDTLTRVSAGYSTLECHSLTDVPAEEVDVGCVEPMPFICNSFDGCEWEEAVPEWYRMFFSTFDPAKYCCACSLLKAVKVEPEWTDLGTGICTSDDGGIPLMYVGQKDTLEECKQTCEDIDGESLCYGVSWEGEKRACQLYTYYAYSVAGFMLIHNRRISWEKEDVLSRVTIPPEGHPSVECHPMNANKATEEALANESCEDVVPFICASFDQCEWKEGTSDFMKVFFSTFDPAIYCCDCKSAMFTAVPPPAKTAVWKTVGTGLCKSSDGGSPLTVLDWKDTEAECKQFCEEVDAMNNVCYGVAYEVEKKACQLYTWTLEGVTDLALMDSKRTSWTRDEFITKTSNADMYPGVICHSLNAGQAAVAVGVEFQAKEQHTATDRQTDLGIFVIGCFIGVAFGGLVSLIMKWKRSTVRFDGSLLYETEDV